MEATLQDLQKGERKRWILEGDGIHTGCGAGYAIWVTEEESRHREGVAVVWREGVGWQVESIANFCPNVVIFLLTILLWRWYAVRAYVRPNNAPTVYRM